ncbi:MAG: hypothetical protein IT285_05110, partial [Bdellovibrionales bacterium]|nr:hypothetical protein [Bdellovibrionales bacterium]
MKKHSTLPFFVALLPLTATVLAPARSLAEDFDDGVGFEPPPVVPIDGGGSFDSFAPGADGFGGEPPPPPAPPIQGDSGAYGVGGARGSNPGETYSGDSADKIPRKKPGKEDFGQVSEEDTEDDTEDTETSSEREEADAPAPAPQSIAAGSRLSRAELRERLIPRYQRHRPQWAIGLLSSLKAFGSEGAAGTASSSTNIIAAALQVEFQPRFLQKFGVLGLGPTLAVYPAGSLTSSVTELFSFGGQIRYQALMFREKPVLPVAG